MTVGEANLGFPVGFQSHKTTHFPVSGHMEDASTDEIARVGINAIQHVERKARHELPMLDDIDVVCVIERDGKDALCFSGWAADEPPSLEEVCLLELDVFEELRDDDG